MKASPLWATWGGIAWKCRRREAHKKKRLLCLISFGLSEICAVLARIEGFHLLSTKYAQPLAMIMTLGL